MKTKKITLRIPVSQWAYIENAFEEPMRHFLHRQIEGWIDDEMPNPIKDPDRLDESPCYRAMRQRVDEIHRELKDRSLAHPKVSPRRAKRLCAELGKLVYKIEHHDLAKYEGRVYPLPPQGVCEMRATA